MSESQAKGPLDIVREIGLEAAELDELARFHLNDQPEMYQDFARQVHDLGRQHPLLGQKVIVYGEPLNGATERRVHPAHSTPAARQSRQRGVYMGLALGEVLDENTRQMSHRVVHVIKVESKNMGHDVFGNQDEKHIINSVYAHGGEVVPVEPIAAHSMVDLKGDKLMREIDGIIFAEPEDAADEHPSARSWEVAARISTLNRLRIFMNEALGNLEWHGDLNQQRVSYLNSLSLLDGIKVVTKDIVFADAEGYANGNEHSFSDTSRLAEPLHLPSFRFEIVAGYARVGGKIIEGGPPELFIASKLINSQVVLAPIKNVEELKLF